MAKRRGKRILLILLSLFFALMIAGAAFIYFAFDVSSWQKIDRSKLENLQQTSLVYDKNGDLLLSLQSLENRTVISLDEVPEHVRNAFIAAEDLRFYEHGGFDVIRMGGALVQNIKSRGIREGASTITQQLVKLTHLSEERVFRRKFEELYLAWQLEQDYSKEDILEMYLNTIYFGRGAYGIQAASEAYFNKDVAALTLPEATALAATIKAPAAYAPHLYPETNKTRRSYIINTMAENELISQKEADEALATSVWVIVREQTERQYGWFIDHALDEAESVLGISSEGLLGSGYRIYTTLDPALQQNADKLFTDTANFPANAKDGTKVQSALCATDVNTGAILAMVGGRDYTVQRGLNRATQMRRQPGSVIKPLSVYGPALELGYTTASVLLDQPGDFNGYTPQNSSRRYSGRVSVRSALRSSLNLPAVRLLEEIGMEASIAYMQRFGLPVTKKDMNLSIALGSMAYGFTPSELSGAYAVFANGGTYSTPYVVDRILSPEGDTVYQHTSEKKRVISTQNAYLMTSLLQTVTQSGTGTRLKIANVPLATKTGTVNMTGGNRDIWVCTYNPEIAVSVWMGYDSADATHTIPNGTTGGSYPAILAASFIKTVYAERTAPDFTMPDGLVWLTLDKRAMQLKGEAMLASDLTPKNYRFGEVFLSSNRPHAISDVWIAPPAPSGFTITYGDDGMPILQFTAQDYGRYRINREANGISQSLTEVICEAGQILTYTDKTAIAGMTYVYTVTPINEELLQNGTLIEGEPVSLIAQVRQSNALLDSLDKILGNLGDDRRNNGPEATSNLTDNKNSLWSIFR